MSPILNMRRIIFYNITKYLPVFIALVLVVNGLLSLFIGAAHFVRPDVHNGYLISLESYLNRGYLKLTAYQKIANGLSVVIGFLLIYLGRGIYQRLRIAWFWSIVLLALVLLNNFTQHFPRGQFYLCLSLLVVLILSARLFDSGAESSSYKQSIAFTTIIFSLLYGVVGSYLLRAQYTGIHNIVDSIYYTLVTYSTLGYGDIVPQTTDAKLFTCSMIIIGLSTFVTAVALYFGPLIEDKIKGVFRVVSTLEKMSKHVIICGDNAMTRYLIEVLKSKHVPVVLVSNKIPDDQDSDNRLVNFVKGDPMSTQVLESCQIRKCSGVIAALNDDADNILITMTAHEINAQQRASAKFKLVTVIAQQENMAKAKRVGASEVVSPTQICGEILADKAMA